MCLVESVDQVGNRLLRHLGAERPLSMEQWLTQEGELSLSLILKGYEELPLTLPPWTHLGPGCIGTPYR